MSRTIFVCHKMIMGNLNCITMLVYNNYKYKDKKMQKIGESQILVYYMTDTMLQKITPA